MKETEDDTTNGKTYCARGWEELVLLERPYYPKQSTDSPHSLPKYQWHFHRTRTYSPTVYVEAQETLNSQSNLEKEQQSSDIEKNRIAAGRLGHWEVETLVVAPKGGNNELTQNKLNVMGEMEAGSTFCPKDFV